FPSEDDFGIVSVEAMRMGVPVIALGKGGASEIVTPNVSGELFEEPTVEMMADAVRRFLEKEEKYNKKTIINESKKYTNKHFKSSLKKIVENVMNDK
ncbi:MAG: glycosyltransferase, partial [Patescibacteria group bacterium]